jgi:hypothetical protein
MMVPYWFARMLEIEQFPWPHARGTVGILANQYDNAVTWQAWKCIVMYQSAR